MSCENDTKICVCPICNTKDCKHYERIADLESQLFVEKGERDKYSRALIQWSHTASAVKEERDAALAEVERLRAQCGIMNIEGYKKGWNKEIDACIDALPMDTDEDPLDTLNAMSALKRKD